jgi:hypothetical protein
MGFTDLGAFGGHDIATPNLDGYASKAPGWQSLSSAPFRLTISLKN